MAEQVVQRRCAIHARKSSEEGLDMSHNSLAAQKDACAAYITSQRHEGWIQVERTYQDGGCSGGNMERPGVKALLDDVAKGLVEVIVVYKIDRLTRSLTDFAKLTELLDKHNVSFVAVTQQFNTSTSMGRLTLNVLLSFAQFEREVSGERIRDKVAASKRKGIWMGGPVPLGYAVKDRRLIIVSEQAEIVRKMFHQYLELKSVHLLQRELEGQGIRSRQRVTKDGRQAGGAILGRGAISHMPKNPLYLGLIKHQGQCHKGEHEAIVAQAQFDQVQALLNTQGPGEDAKCKRATAALLKGLIFDGKGHKLLPTHCNKKGRRYHYYTSQHRLCCSGDQPPVLRVPAPDLEALAIRSIASRLGEGYWLEVSFPAASTALPKLIDTSRSLSTVLLDPQMPNPDLIRSLIDHVPVEKTCITNSIDRVCLHRRLGLGASARSSQDTENGALGPMPHLQIFVQSHLLRCGKRMKLIMGNDMSGHRTPNPKLLPVIVQAREWFEGLSDGTFQSLRDVATAAKLDKSYISRVITLAFLAPDILEKIITGYHSPALTPERLRKTCPLPLLWEEQRALLLA